MWVSTRWTGRPRLDSSRRWSDTTRASEGASSTAGVFGTSAGRPRPVDMPADPAGDDLVALVDGFLLQVHQAAIRLRGGATGIVDPDPAAQHVARPYRSEPAKFVEARRTHARDLGYEAVDDHAHHDGAGHPAAGDQPAIGGILRRLGVDMEGLRIVALRKPDDLLLGNRVLAELDDLAGLIILEPALLERNGAHERLLRVSTTISMNRILAGDAARCQASRRRR